MVFTNKDPVATHQPNKSKIDHVAPWRSMTDNNVVGGISGLFILMSRVNHRCIGNSVHRFVLIERERKSLSPMHPSWHVTITTISSCSSDKTRVCTVDTKLAPTQMSLPIWTG